MSEASDSETSDLDETGETEDPASSSSSELEHTPDSDEKFVEAQEEAAAAEAGGIGGEGSDPDEELDPAMRPLAEAGQGESEGFEDAEAELIEHASHGDSGPDPTHMAGEVEGEHAGDASYGEGDHAEASEDEAESTAEEDD